MKQMFFWNSLAFSVFQWMLAIWSLVSLPFLNPTGTSRSSQFMYCWSLAWRILSITLLACQMSAIPWPQIKLRPLLWDLGVLTTEPPGKSLYSNLKCLTCCELPSYFPKLHHFTFSPAVSEGSSFSTSLPTLVLSLSLILAILVLWNSRSLWFWFATP